MNPREKKLLVALIAIVSVGLGVVGGWRWFWVPLQSYNKQLMVLQDATDAENFKLFTFMKEREKLKAARKKSLPAGEAQASLAYSKYLTAALGSSGLAYENISHTAARDVPMAAAISGIKKTGHQSMTFTIRARGTLKQLVSFLERVQRTPYEHRISTLTIDPVDLTSSTSDRLAIHMILETLLVAGSTNTEGTPPRDVEVPMPLSRSYAKIAEKNIFLGGKPPYQPPRGKKIDTTPIEEEPEVQPKEFVPRYVRLTQIVPDQQTAYLRNLIYKKPEIKLVAKPRSGYEYFFVEDEATNHLFFKAKVLRVDAREVYFQVKDKVYGVSIGQSLADAMGGEDNSYALSIERRDELGLIELFDREFMKKELGEDKKGSGKKKAGKGRR